MATFQLPLLCPHHHHHHRHHNPSAFRRSAVARTDHMTGPLIDLSELHGDSTTRSLAVSKIGRACCEPCFFQVVNHGIPPAITGHALRLATGFFDMSLEDKMEWASDDIVRPVRYGHITDTNHCQCQRFFLKHYSHPLRDWIELWPTKPVGYRRVMATYAMAVRKVSLQVIGAIFESLGLSRNYLREEMEAGMQLMAINDYPAYQKPEIMSGIAPHSDYLVITVLLQSSEGLEELDDQSGIWNLVRGFPDSLIVHIGDSLEVISNGRYRSAVHRVAMVPGRRRISVASLHGLAMNHKVEVARELVDQEHPRGYRESSFRDFLDFLSSTSNAERGDGKNYLDTLKIAPGLNGRK